MTRAEEERAGADADAAALLFLAAVEVGGEARLVSAGDSPAAGFLFFFPIAH